MPIRMMEHLDNLHIWLSNVEARISQPTNELSHVEQGETSQVYNQENPKTSLCLNRLEGCLKECMMIVTFLEISQRM